MKRFTTFLVILSAVLAATTVIGWNKDVIFPAASSQQLSGERAESGNDFPTAQQVAREAEEKQKLEQQSVLLKQAVVEECSRLENRVDFRRTSLDRFFAEDAVQDALHDAAQHKGILFLDLNVTPSLDGLIEIDEEDNKKIATPDERIAIRNATLADALKKISTDEQGNVVELYADFGLGSLRKGDILWSTNEVSLAEAFKKLVQDNVDSKGVGWYHKNENLEYWAWACTDEQKQSCAVARNKILTDAIVVEPKIEAQFPESELFIVHENKLFGLNNKEFSSAIESHLDALTDESPLTLSLLDQSKLLAVRKSLPGNNCGVVLVQHIPALPKPEPAKKPGFVPGTGGLANIDQAGAVYVPIAGAGLAFFIILIGGLLIIRRTSKNCDDNLNSKSKALTTLEKKLTLVKEENKELSAKLAQHRTQLQEARTAYSEQKELRIKAENALKESLTESQEEPLHSSSHTEILGSAVQLDDGRVRELTKPPATSDVVREPPVKTPDVKPPSQFFESSAVHSQNIENKGDDPFLSDSEWEDLADSFEAMLSEEFGGSAKKENVPETKPAPVAAPASAVAPKNVTEISKPIMETDIHNVIPFPPDAPSNRVITPALKSERRLTPASQMAVSNRVNPGSSSAVELPRSTMLGVPVSQDNNQSETSSPFVESSVSNNAVHSTFLSLSPAAPRVSAPTYLPPGVQTPDENNANKIPTVDLSAKKNTISERLAMGPDARLVTKPKSVPSSIPGQFKPVTSTKPAAADNIDNNTLRDALKRRSADAKKSDTTNSFGTAPALSKSGVFSVTGSRVDIDPLSDTEYFRALYDVFIETKKQCGESVDNVTLERFMSRLARNKETLMKTYKCKTVKFQIYVKDGKTALKATPINK